MSSSSSSSSGGAGFLSLLTILFVGLKLTHYINWSWWWVLSPVWLSVVVIIGGLLVLWLGTVLLKKTPWYRRWKLKRDEERKKLREERLMR